MDAYNKLSFGLCRKYRGGVCQSEAEGGGNMHFEWKKIGINVEIYVYMFSDLCLYCKNVFSILDTNNS